MPYNFQKIVGCFKGCTLLLIGLVSLVLSGCPGPEGLQPVNNASTNTNQSVRKPVDQEAVMQAIEKDDVATFNQLLENGLDIHERLEGGKTALHIAAEKGSIQILGNLLEKEVDVNAKFKVDWDKEDWTPLHIAIEKGNIAIVKTLLANEADVHAKAKLDAWHKNWTPLHFATAKGNVEIISLLLESGADVDAADDEGSTALHIAVEIANVAMVEALLNHRADVHAKATCYFWKKAWTPLHIAVNKGNIAIVGLLLEQGADVHAVDKTGITPLNLAFEQSIAIVGLLVEHGADIHRSIEDGNSLVELAINQGDIKLLEALLKASGQCNSYNQAGKTALHMAVEKGNKDLVLALLQWGADINQQTKTGLNVLYIAGMNGHQQLVEDLLNNGALASLKTALDKMQLNDLQRNFPGTYALCIAKLSTTSVASFEAWQKEERECPICCEARINKHYVLCKQCLQPICESCYQGILNNATHSSCPMCRHPYTNN